MEDLRPLDSELDDISRADAWQNEMSVQRARADAFENELTARMAAEAAEAFEKKRLEALLHCFKDFVHDALRKAHAKRRNEPVKYAWGDQSAATDEAFYDDVLRAEGVLHPGCQTSRFPGF